MAKKTNQDKKKPFSFATESPLVKQTEQAVMNGYQSIEQNEKQGGGVKQPDSAPFSVGDGSAVAKTSQEQTKGVQAYIPMSMYRKLNNLKYERGETIGNLLVQAISFWLDAQGQK